MKLLIAVIALGVCVIPGFAEERSSAQITFAVKDDFGKPVAGATIGMSTFHHWQPGEGFGKDISETFTGVTNDKGLVTLIGRSLDGDFAYGPRELAGFYRGGGGEVRFLDKAAGRWEPFNQIINIEMKPILNPIPMYAKQLGVLPYEFNIPKGEEPFGFDLMKGDWVTPFGAGTTPDLLFEFTEGIPYKSVDKPFSATLKLTFSNPLDGIQSVLVPLNEGSALRLPRYAPDAGYLAELVKHIGRPAEDKPVETGIREDQNYFFRVRTIVDEKGKIKSANYGKIVGDIKFWGDRGMQFTYYLNPTSLDRNMEFDPKRNLFTNLPGGQKVFEP